MARGRKPIYTTYEELREAQRRKNEKYYNEHREELKDKMKAYYHRKKTEKDNQSVYPYIPP